MAANADVQAAAEDLRKQLRYLRNYQHRVWFGEGLGMIFAVLIPAMGLTMVLDNIFHFDLPCRLLMLTGLVCAGVALLKRLMQTSLKPLTLEQIALKLERKYPNLDNHIINSLLLSQEEDMVSQELVQSIIEESKEEVSHVDISSSVPKRRMWVLIGSGACAVALMAVYFFLVPDYFQNAFLRLFPIGNTAPLTRTRIVEITPADTNVLSGDNVDIDVKVEGWFPETAQLVYKPEDDDLQVVAMLPGEERGHFSLTMKELSRTFTYRIAAGDAKSPEYKILVQDRPVIANLNVTLIPPKYTGLDPQNQKSSTIKALRGTTVDLRGVSSKELAIAELVLSGREPQRMRIVIGTTVSGAFPVEDNGTYRIDLTDTSGFPNRQVEHQIEAILDEPPEIRIGSPPSTSTLSPNDTLPLQCTVTDRYGVRDVELVKLAGDLLGGAQETSIRKWEAEERTERSLHVDCELPVSSLAIKPGESGIFQIVARDWNDVTGTGITRSRKLTVKVMLPSVALEEDKKSMMEASAELTEIIRKQRENLAMGQEIRTDILGSTEPAFSQKTEIAGSMQFQGEIRVLSGKVLERMDRKLPVRPILQLLYENEMIEAVRQLKGVPEAEKPADALKVALETERTIIARLSGRNEQLREAMDLAALRDIFATLDAIIKEQKKIRDATKEAVGAGAGGPNDSLADREDLLAEKTSYLKEQLTDHAAALEQSDPSSASRFREAAGMLEARAVRQDMMRVATKLAKGDLAPSLPIQEEIIKDLREIAAFLRQPLIADATKKLEELKDLAKKGREKAEKLAKLQGAIKEISEELERSKDLTEGENEEMKMKKEELKELRQNMQDVVEQMAKDLHLFPEIPACNEIAEKSREVFEDIDQVVGSEEDEVKEIAVDRDEGMLEALKKVEERFADMEEWLMDKPDTTKWKQEGWDTEEIAEIPLVDLPEELEDLVGDLVDQEDEMSEEANDSASNATIGDAPMGWDVADGPISSFGAKGKSGNERPNDNELSGRSGAGREGPSNGEIVGKVAKDLEGTATKARRTHDPFSKGNIEEENPNSLAKATGGGKQSGIGGEGGLRGSAPARNQLHMRNIARRQQDIRRNAESLYTKASLLHLPTGELDEAVLLMHKAEKQARDGDIGGFGETQRRIAHALRNTKRGMNGEGSLALDPRLKLPKFIKEEMVDSTDEPVPPEFEKLVSEYYKAIASGAAK